MFKYKPPVNVHEEPWLQWEEDFRPVYGNCRHCNVPYQQPHFEWCEWYRARYAADQSDNDSIKE